ncbi:hypothetical protein ACFFRR_003075 [Megaselia abdita]
MDTLLGFYPAVSIICEKLDFQELKHISVLSKAWLDITNDIFVNRSRINISKIPEQCLSHLKRNYKKVRVSSFTLELKPLNIPSSAVDVYLKAPLSEVTFHELQSLKKLRHLKIDDAVLSHPSTVLLNNSLESLDMVIWNDNSVSLLKNLLHGNKYSLQALKIHEFGIHDFNYLKTTILPNLKMFLYTLSNDVQEKCQSLETFFENHTNLEEIVLKNIHMSDAFFKTFVKNSKNTRKLCIRNSSAENIEISEFEKMTNLEMLEFINFHFDLNKFCRIKITNLQSLHIEQLNEYISNEELEIFLKNHTKLTSLSMICYFSEKFKFSFFAKYLPRIHKLELSNIKLSLKNIETFQNLQILSLENCLLDNALLLHLNAPRLRSVVITDSFVSESGIKVLTERSPMIEKLNLKEGLNINDLCTKFIVENLIYLKYLDISSCKQITILSLELVLTKSRIIKTTCQYSSIRTEIHLKDLSESNGFELKFDNGWEITNGARKILL